MTGFGALIYAASLAALVLGLWVGIQIGIGMSVEHGPKGACERLTASLLLCEEIP